MTSMILVRLERLREFNNSYPDIMFGIRRSRCAVDSIIDLVTNIQQHRVQRRICAAVSFEIKVAFNNVTRDAILTALEDLGLRGWLCSWISNYLNDRTVFISTPNGSSQCHLVKRGVPQGRVLSPTAFNIVLAGLTNELPKNVQASLYADDICIWASEVTRFQIHAPLQSAVSVFYNYLQRCGLQLSADKSSLLAFTRRRMEQYLVLINDEVIRGVHSHIFLGVVIDRRLTWNPHVTYLNKLVAFTHSVRYISGTTGGASVSFLLRLRQVCFLGLLRYSLPLLNGTCKTNLRTLQSLHGQTLLVCLGLPKTTSTNGTIAESRQLPILSYEE